MMGLQVIIMVGFLTVIGAVIDARKKAQRTEEVLDLPETGWMIMMIWVGSKEVVSAAEVKIGGLRTREAVGLIG